MEKLVKMSLRQKNGEFKEYMFDYVPLSKRHEYIKKERDLSERKDEQGNFLPPSSDEYELMQIDFVASLFNDKTLTRKAILEGLDTTDSKLVQEIIRYRVLGFSETEDAERKKAVVDKILLGQNSTTSI